LRAVILCAGIGSRLRPYTLETPKCLVEVDNVPLLTRQINVLNHCGVNKLTIVGGYKYEQLLKINRNANVIVNDQYTSTNMLYSLALWFKSINLDDIDEDILVSYGDIVYSKQIIKLLNDDKNQISVAVDLGWKEYWRQRSDNPLDDLESLKLSANNKIIDIGQKVSDMKKIEGQYIGLIRLKRSILADIKRILVNTEMTGYVGNKPYIEAYLTDFLQYLIQNDINIHAVTSTFPWIEIDTVSDLKLEETIRRAHAIEHEL